MTVGIGLVGAAAGAGIIGVAIVSSLVGDAELGFGGGVLDITSSLFLVAAQTMPTADSNWKLEIDRNPTAMQSDPYVLVTVDVPQPTWTAVTPSPPARSESVVDVPWDVPKDCWDAQASEDAVNMPTAHDADEKLSNHC